MMGCRIEELPRGRSRLLAVLAAALIALAAAGLIPAAQAFAAMTPLTYTVEIEIESATREYGSVIVEQGANPDVTTMRPGERKAFTVKPNEFFEVKVSPNSIEGKIKSIKMDDFVPHGYLFGLEDTEGALAKTYLFSFEGTPGAGKVERNHRMHVVFAERFDPVQITGELEMKAGEAVEVNHSVAYGKWSEDDAYYKVFDLRRYNENGPKKTTDQDYTIGSNLSKGEVYIKALKSTAEEKEEKLITYTTWDSKEGGNWPKPAETKLKSTSAEPGRFTVFMLAGAGGETDYVHNQSVKEGESITVKVMPYTGYKILSVIVDDKALPLSDEDKKGDYSYTFSNVTEHHDLIALFERVDEVTLESENYEGYVNETATWLASPNDGTWVYDDEFVNCAPRTEGAEWVHDVTFKKAGTTKMTYYVDGKSKEVNVKIYPTPVIKASAGAGGRIDPEGEVAVNEGEGKTFTITPAAGYLIDKVFVDGKNKTSNLVGNKYTFDRVYAVHTIQATFSKITGVEDAELFVGETVSMTPLPAGGTWTVGDPGVLGIKEDNGTATFTGLGAGATKVTYEVNGETVSATVTVRPVHTVKASADPGGSIDPAGDVAVKDGHKQSFKVTPASTYMIDQVLVDGADATDQLRGGAYTFKSVTADHTIHATFKKIVIGGLPSNQSLLMEESVSLTPTPAGGTWQIDDGTVLSLSERGGTATFTGLKPGATKATYTLNGASWAVSFTVALPPPRTIKASAGANGSIAPSGDVQVEFGSGQTFTLAADQHYMIDKLLVDGAEATPKLQNKAYTYTFENVRRDHEIEVTFKPLAIGGLEDKELFVGESASMAPTPGGGDWTLADPDLLSLVEQNGVWTFTGLKAGSTKATYRVGGESADVTFTVKPVHTIVASAGAGGSIDPSGDVPVKDGESQAFAIEADPHYMIDKLLVDGAEVASQPLKASYEFKHVREGHRIEARFKGLVIGNLPSSQELVVGGTVVLDPTPTGGTWTIDDETVLTRLDQGSVLSLGRRSTAATFKALKPGTAKATYTVNGTSREVTFTVKVPARTIKASSSGNGTISPSGDVEAEVGFDKKFVITPDPRHMIGKLLVDGREATAQPEGGAYVYVFGHVQEDHEIAVEFVPLQIGGIPNEAEIVVGGSTSFTPTPPGGAWTYDRGVLSLVEQGGTATFTGLKPGTAKATYTVNGVSRDVSFTVAPASFTIKAAAGAGGSIEPRGDVVVKRGADQEFAVTPDAGYRLERLLVDGEDAASRMRGSSFTFESVTADHAIEATFAPVAIPKPDDPAKPKPLVRTGDSALPAALLGAAALAAVVGAAAARRMRRR